MRLLRSQSANGWIQPRLCLDAKRISKAANNAERFDFLYSRSEIFEDLDHADTIIRENKQ